MFINKHKIIIKKLQLILMGLIVAAQLLAVPMLVSAAAIKTSNSTQAASHQCGTQSEAVKTSLDFGCKGEQCLHGSTAQICTSSDHQVNAILDGLFAIIRFLSIGAGLVIIASVVVAGIQYTTSRGDPQAAAKAIGRITDTLIALLIFIFAYSIINWLVPAGLLK